MSEGEREPAEAGLRLELIEGDASPARLSLDDRTEACLGKDESCEVRVAGRRVSGRHARLTREDEGWMIEDLESGTGTKVNEEYVTRGPVRSGDRIQLGGCVLQLVAGPAEPLSEGTARRLLETLTTLLSADDGEEPRFEAMLDGLLDALSADRGLLFLPGTDGEFREVCRRRRPDSRLDPGAPISRSLVTRSAAEDAPLLLTTTETEELRGQIQSISPTTCSILAASLGPDVGGVLYLDSLLERRCFEERDRLLLLGFARAAGGALARAADGRRIREENERLAELGRRRLGGTEILGDSPAIERLREEIDRAASRDISVIVTGESGTGKELVARALHRRSDRRDGPFVAVNCAAVPPELIESELFGHEKGAFTGADSRRLGHFELAGGGTLFLDEIGELPLAAQGSLLRALQERVVKRLGGRAEVPVDFRLVCATNVALEEAVAQGRFREDLLYRIAVFPLRLPPLRERGEDIVTLANEFLLQAAREFRFPVRRLGEGAVARLRSHPWPGNVRELKNLIQQAVLRSDGEELGAAALEAGFGLGSTSAPTAEAPASGTPPEGEVAEYPVRLEEARREFEARFLRYQLTRLKGNMKATSEAIGLTRKNLYRKCEDLGIDYKTFR